MSATSAATAAAGGEGEVEDNKKQQQEGGNNKKQEERGEAGAGGEEQKEKPKVNFDPNKDLWANISLNVKDVAESSIEMTVLFVGARHCGKTSVINRLSPGSLSTQTPKPTTALEYSYGKREDRNVTSIAHFWELAQGAELAQLADVVLTPETIHQSIACICVDCHDLGTMFQTSITWLRRIDRRVQDIFQRMRAKGSNTPEKMMNRMKKRVGEEHPDLKNLRLSGLPTVLICSRLDMLKEDTVRVKLIVNTMRFIAHQHGASLLFTSESEREVSKLRAMLSHMIFSTNLDTRNFNFDPEKGGVLIPAGQDSFHLIGDPHPSNRPNDFVSTGDNSLDRWKVPFDVAFPPRVLREGGGGGGSSQGHQQQGGGGSHQSGGGNKAHDEFHKMLYDPEDGAAEPIVDATRKQKDSELEQYRRALASKKD